MTLLFLHTLAEALRVLTDKTGTTWTSTLFYNAVIKHSLPLRATTPNDCQPVIESMGQQHGAGLPALGHRRHALLLTSAIRDLALHGETQTRMVALEPGDPGFMDWTAIKARRLELDQGAHTAEEWEALWPGTRWVDGDFMGESEVVVLSHWVRVTDGTCRVPAETIETLQGLRSTVAQNSGPTPISGVKHRMVRNSLDGAIEAAIKLAGSTSSPDVWVQLRELAKDGTPPFTGLVEGDKLVYVDDNNEIATLSKDALRKRLDKYRSSAG